MKRSHFTLLVVVLVAGAAYVWKTRNLQSAEISPVLNPFPGQMIPDGHLGVWEITALSNEDWKSTKAIAGAEDASKGRFQFVVSETEKPSSAAGTGIVVLKDGRTYDYEFRATPQGREIRFLGHDGRVPFVKLASAPEQATIEFFKWSEGGRKWLPCQFLYQADPATEREPIETSLRWREDGQLALLEHIGEKTFELSTFGRADDSTSKAVMDALEKQR